MERRLIPILFLIFSGSGSFSQDDGKIAHLPLYPVDTFAVIYDMIALVDTQTVVSHVQHLQDLVTRNCLTPQAVEAQNWIKGQFESYGLSVELQDISSFSFVPSMNVIATLPGKTSPEKNIIIGAHYDSYAIPGTAPGADDNASGTSGVLEVARILSQYHFEQSVVFCAFSAEEFGLVGSEAYASRAETEGMNILGYFNLDMIGYRYPGEDLHTDMIAPESAKELSDFYKAVTLIYLPDFTVYDAVVIPGGSDHISFNNHGYMGIFPCEEDENYSPLIHTANDLIGPSFNSALKASRFIQAGLASVVSLARPMDHAGIPVAGIQHPDYSIYPNPAIGKVTIETSKYTPVDITISSMTGKRMLNKTFTRAITVIITGWPEGIYLVQFSDNGNIRYQKLVIQ